MAGQALSHEGGASPAEWRKRRQSRPKEKARSKDSAENLLANSAGGNERRYRKKRQRAKARARMRTSHRVSRTAFSASRSIQLRRESGSRKKVASQAHTERKD